MGSNRSPPTSPRRIQNSMMLSTPLSRSSATLSLEPQKRLGLCIDLEADELFSIYLNYAEKYQDPIPGYGAASVKKLKAARKKYDPDQFFPKLVKGGFKLPNGGGGGGDGAGDDEIKYGGH
ncbi:hypothetical protein BKA65DRAFT_567753 [Rhexocercosporidium sp. MPI-PUGE-AT-0058]|nr:hypothetical protein BKA65DRAFT_567753 [Rhexocercosporidium sp. MPI-PUGE-AT-0058]